MESIRGLSNVIEIGKREVVRPGSLFTRSSRARKIPTSIGSAGGAEESASRAPSWAYHLSAGSPDALRRQERCTVPSRAQRRLVQIDRVDFVVTVSAYVSDIQGQFIGDCPLKVQ